MRKSDRQDIATVNVRGISVRKLGKWREAIAEYSRVLSVVPDNAGLMYNTALAYSEGKEYAHPHGVESDGACP